MADIAAPSVPTNMRISTAQAPVTTPPEEAMRKGYLGLDMFSPVNQNGSFEFDRVLKSGEVLKRTKKTKNWKTAYLVLRPHTLSIYKDREETRLRHQISLSELTAVARQRDPSKKAKHVFGLFSPSRNYHLAALSDQDAQAWVELIRRESRIDQEEEEMILASPSGAKSATYKGFERHRSSDKKLREQMLSSSSEGEGLTRASSSVKPTDLRGARRPSHTIAYSGTEQASFSDFSDTPVPSGFRDSTLSFSQPNEGTTGYENSISGNPGLGRNLSQMSSVGSNTGNNVSSKKPDEERVVCHGWLYILKSKGGVRQWKKHWVVLRPKCLALYKNDDEYSATLIIPFPNIINAVEIDPMSKTKRFCMQLIAEDRNYRFCAPDEEATTKWLGAFKSLLAKRKEASLQRAAAEKNGNASGGAGAGQRVASGPSSAAAAASAAGQKSMPGR